MQSDLKIQSEEISPKNKLLEAINVRAGYQTRTILSDLNFTIYEGEIYALLGANGSGKTTTLSLFLGFIQPFSGAVFVNHINVATDRSAALQQIAYIPENVALYDHLSAYENIDYFLKLSGQKSDKHTITQALLRAGLQKDAINQRTSGFSKGMRQKVAIALAVTRKVPILLLDEPTSGLDPHASNEFNQLLHMLREQKVTILMVTHDLFGATKIADRIGFIAQGKLVEEITALGNSEFDIKQLEQPFDIKKLYQRYVSWSNS
ncbi:ABC transporter ATP-binding protein [Acinetobacter sp. Marseille-Q1618]|uniref:ABC transporter ATP-binding protein n=1 Tax=Acinetobacter sp. Marseille-Q1618 TaxID=2697502 RepID=UPI00156DB087|nr:ABC transporter ATP-binding protein [Acinetobacter sp. Marseille-Q1618]